MRGRGAARRVRDVRATPRSPPLPRAAAADSRVKLEETKRQKEEELAAKDAEISDLKGKMSEMASEFGEMLQETLKKMTERIEISNTRWECTWAVMGSGGGGQATGRASP